MSIKDRGYYLPIIHATEFFEEKVNSANKPLLIRGTEEQSGEKLDVVVKLSGAERMNYTAAKLKEVLALFIAMEWEIPCVKPVIVNITPQFVETLRGHNTYQVASKSLGINFGSENIAGLRTLPGNEPLSNTQKKFALNIFAYDAFISNPDRTYNKPNMITDGKVIYILDHELGFSFTMDLIKNEEPWNLSEADNTTLRRHVLYKRIKGEDFPDDEILPKFDKLDQDFWSKAEQLIPDEWLSEQIVQIRDYLNSISAHKEKFVEQLNRVIA